MGGLYSLALVASPALADIVRPPLDISKVPAPKIDENRIIIPKIGVNITFGEGAESLDRGAEWRNPDHGNPADGGNFIIAAHRFSIQPTPMSTIEKSPFYNISKLQKDDHIFVDYKGERYAYKITERFEVAPTQTEIEETSEKPKLTLYSCTLGGAADGRDVIIAEPIGKVAVADN